MNNNRTIKQKKLSERYKDFNIENILKNKSEEKNFQIANNKNGGKKNKIKLKKFITEILYKTGKITSKNNYAIENFLTDDMFYIKLTAFLNSLLKDTKTKEK